MRHALLFFLSLSFPYAALAGDSTFKVGALLCLTGECAETGTNSRKGIQLAAEELNREGGVLGRKVEVVYEDSREMDGAGSAVSAFRRLMLDPEVHYMIGPSWTVGGLPLAPILAKRGDVIAISPSLGVADYNEAADTIFTIWPHDSSTTETLAQYAWQKGYRKLAILSDENPWESRQAKHFHTAYEALGGKVVSFLEPNPSQKDLRTEVAKMRMATPDAILMTNYTNMDIAAKEIRRQQWNIPMFGILLDDTRLANARSELEGIIFAQYPSPTSTFAQRFREMFHEAPGMSSDTAYDALKAIATAIQNANTFDPNIVKTHLLKIDLDGASGKLKFDAKGGVQKLPELYQIQNGERVRLGSAQELLHSN